MLSVALGVGANAAIFSLLDAKHAGGVIPSPPCDEADIPEIARGQIGAEERAARRSNRI